MTRRPVRRPMLLPAVRRLWRNPHRLQVGTDPARAVVLELADAGQARLLDLLDGSHSESGLLRAARLAGIRPEDASAMLRALTDAGYVIDAHALRLPRASESTRRRLATELASLALTGRRPGDPLPDRQPDDPLPDRQSDDALPDRPSGEAASQHADSAGRPDVILHRRLRAQVLITGASRLAVPIASILAAAGVGRLHADQQGVARLSDAAPAGLLPGDAHRPRGIAASDALRRIAPELEFTTLRPAAATFAVLVGFSAPASLTAFAYGTRRLAHLAVNVRDSAVVVGPLVRPGQSPCLNCVELCRAELDPDWPAVAAQLHTSPEVAEPVAATTLLAAAAFAAHETLVHIDGGDPTTLGATVEITEPGHHVRRQWSPHPSCGCRRRRRRPA